MSDCLHRALKLAIRLIILSDINSTLALLCKTLVEKYHGRFSIIFKSLFCALCNFAIWHFAQLPQTWHPYRIMAWNITLCNIILFSIDYSDFLFTRGYTSLVLIFILFSVCFTCWWNSNFESRWIPKYFTEELHSIDALATRKWLDGM